MKVELEFELGRHRYRVVRTRNNAELYLDGDDAPIANTSSGVTERRAISCSASASVADIAKETFG